jgi:phosphate-selective porin OprO/OprP
MCFKQPSQILYRLTTTFIILSLAFLQNAWSEPANKSTQASAPELFDNIWDAATLYRNPDNPAIQSFALVGRYHGQYWSVDANQGNADGWENRRIIFGFEAVLSEEFLFQAQMHVNADLSPVYKGLYVGFLKWTPKQKDIAVSFGRLDYVYAGLERTTSSKKMVTFERGLLVNQLMPGEVFGLYSKTKNGANTVQAGLFTGSTKEEFGDFSSGQAITLGIEHELPLFYDKGSLHLDYLYNDGDRDNSSFKPYRNVASLWHQGSKGAYTMGIDFTSGSGGHDGKSSVWGLTLLPTYELSQNLFIGGDTLQLALRYQYARSVESNGLLLQKRYEQEVTIGGGDKYQAFYLGLNYLLNGDKLKLMAGAEYAEMDDPINDGGDYQGWTYFAGLRLYF